MAIPRVPVSKKAMADRFIPQGAGLGASERTFARIAWSLGVCVLALVAWSYIAGGLQWRDLWWGWRARPERIDRDRIRALRALQLRDPVADADAAIARQDYRLKALGGYSSWIPAPSPIFEWVNESSCARSMTPGTGSDAITWVPQHLWNVDSNYAVAYNARMLGRVSVNVICGNGEPWVSRIRDVEEHLQAMKAADPVTDAVRRLSAGDYRLIAVQNSTGGIVPGVENSSGWEPPLRCNRFWEGELRILNSGWALEPRRLAEGENRLGTFILETYGPAFNRRMLEGAPLWRFCLTSAQYRVAMNQRELRADW